MSPPPFSLRDVLARLDAVAERAEDEQIEAVEAEAYALGYAEGRTAALRAALDLGRPRA